MSKVLRFAGIALMVVLGVYFILYALSELSGIRAEKRARRDVEERMRKFQEEQEREERKPDDDEQAP